jgi:hypothetical protein
VGYTGHELLLQAVESQDQCPDSASGLPQLPCTSKLYLGGKIVAKKTYTKLTRLTYQFTLRNGGIDDANGVQLRVEFPQESRVNPATLPPDCDFTVGPPTAVICDAGSIATPPGDAVKRVTFTLATTVKVARFLANATIEAPNVVDPQGDGRHTKTVAVSTRFAGPVR